MGPRAETGRRDASNRDFFGGQGWGGGMLRALTHLPGPLNLQENPSSHKMLGPLHIFFGSH